MLLTTHYEQTQALLLNPGSYVAQLPPLPWPTGTYVDETVIWSLAAH